MVIANKNVKLLPQISMDTYYDTISSVYSIQSNNTNLTSLFGHSSSSSAPTTPAATTSSSSPTSSPSTSLSIPDSPPQQFLAVPAAKSPPARKKAKSGDMSTATTAAVVEGATNAAGRSFVLGGDDAISNTGVEPPSPSAISDSSRDDQSVSGDFASSSGNDVAFRPGQSGQQPQPGSTLSSMNSRDDRAKRLRLELSFFFMNPIEKWEARRQFPWKLCVQLLKIILVTVQICLFGQMRVSNIRFVGDSNIVFRNLFLKGWDTTRDQLQYPPPNGAFAVFTYDKLYDNIYWVLKEYATLNTTALGSFDYDYDDVNSAVPPLSWCRTRYAVGKVFPFNATYVFDTRLETTCFDIPINDETISSASNLTAYLVANNASIDCDRLEHADLNFRLRAIHLKNLQPYDTPDCFLFNVKIVYDNSDHTGQLVISLDAEANFINRCKGNITYQIQNNINRALLDVLDVMVLLACTSSIFLCTRALWRAERLKRKTERYFKEVRIAKMRPTDRLRFLNLGYVIILINDALITIGTIFKLSIEFKWFDSQMFTATGIMLGIGNLLVWCGVLRYMGFFSQYNVLILTMKKSFPNILRFMLCAAMIYFGFMFCGWAVLGPYHFKFKTLMSTSECLFSLVNGDDMFATFNTTPDTNSAVWWFARVYLYSFICLFIYVVLSLFIAIIMDSYEVIKDLHDLNLGVNKNHKEPAYLRKPSARIRKYSTNSELDRKTSSESHRPCPATPPPSPSPQAAASQLPAHSLQATRARSGSISNFLQHLTTRERFDVGENQSDLASFLAEDKPTPESGAYRELEHGTGCFNLISVCYTSFRNSFHRHLSRRDRDRTYNHIR